MRKRTKGVLTHIVLGPEDDDCPLCKFEGTPEELEEKMKEHGGIVLEASPREPYDGEGEEGHWEELRLARGMIAKKWVKKSDGC